VNTSSAEALSQPRGARGARIAAIVVFWSCGRSPKNTGPTSNRATSGKPWRALRPAASIRLGRIDGRMQSSSEAIGLASTSSAAPPPNSAAIFWLVKLQVTVSL
jgi:hypothetical protein